MGTPYVVFMRARVAMIAVESSIVLDELGESIDTMEACHMSLYRPGRNGVRCSFADTRTVPQPRASSHDRVREIQQGQYDAMTLGSSVTNMVNANTLTDDPPDTPHPYTWSGIAI